MAVDDEGCEVTATGGGIWGEGTKVLLRVDSEVEDEGRGTVDDEEREAVDEEDDAAGEGQGTGEAEDLANCDALADGGDIKGSLMTA